MGEPSPNGIFLLHLGCALHAELAEEVGDDNQLTWLARLAEVFGIPDETTH